MSECGQYDNRTSNPEGRVLSDHSTRSKALLRCRRPFTMGTFNANTVREEGRLEELAHCAEERGVEILGIQEHRRVHAEDQIVYHRVAKCWSVWRNEAQAATGGVGLLLSSRARMALLRVHYHTNRILSADFDGNPVTNVIVVYSPTNVAQAQKVEKFYEDLATAVRDIPAHNFLAILGDFNARLGPEDAPLTYHNSTNRNGEHLAALLMEHELLAANTMFQKRMGKRLTFQDQATVMPCQLDYILVRRRWRNSILNAEPYSTFNSVGSDHQVVSMRVRPSLRVPKPSLKTRYDWKAFSASPGLQTRYAVEVRNCFQLLGEEEEPNAQVQAVRCCERGGDQYVCSSYGEEWGIPEVQASGGHGGA
ncbi:craniofacial development protein 2-like [Cottoperca gobio]|uniref:Craniofacial development protein 2-like n=1 Tax=Cottoperca gobio TaxID=56716 RepID=A0A6J2PSH9_COTGO|nr:craniofacial development protein 2-like [Cottoperca gobio]